MNRKLKLTRRGERVLDVVLFAMVVALFLVAGIMESHGPL